MKMQKSTMILSGVLGVISVGSVLMFANPGMQEGLASNIVSPFRKVLRNTYVAPVAPAKPFVPAQRTNSWGTYQTSPRVSGETIIQPTRIPGGVIIAPKPSISGETIIRPVVLTNTGIIAPIGSLTMVSDYFGTQKRENISEAGAKDICMTEWKKYETNSQYRSLTCTWNGKIIYSIQKGYTPTITGTNPSINYYTGYTTAPISIGSYTGGTSSGTQIRNSMIVTVDGKNQPDIYNNINTNYRLSDMEAIYYCANLASKVPTTIKFSCVWNGKELGKGFGTKVVTSISTGATNTGTISTGNTSTGSVSNGQLLVYADGQLSSSAGMHNNITKDSALTICKGYIPNLGMMVKVECRWNNVVIFTGLGTKKEFKILINGFLVESKVDITRQFANEQCEKTQINTSTNKTVSCIWNDVTLYSGNGKQVIAQTNSGSTSSGSNSTGVTNTGVTSTGSVVGVLRVLKDGYNFGTTSTYLYTGTKDGALTFCKGMLSNIGITNQVECLWNDISIFKGFGTMSRLEVYINNKRSTLLDSITKQAATEYCETIKTTTPSTQTLICRWNDITIYTGNGKQVITQTNSGSTSTGVTSSGSTSTGSIK